ncbi:MAG TPA: hypothetical protein VKY65_01285 [Alphaproteobacteria bacterium]|nr:hypothetical protein [Alphaproteobacteria bacterium]
MGDADVFYAGGTSSSPPNYVDPSLSIAAAQQQSGDGDKLNKFLWGTHGLSFHSLLQSLNPLQYIPIVSSIYREETGDSIGAVASAIGGTLIGGPIGAVTSLANSLFAAATGKDVGGHVYAALFEKDKSPGNGSTTPALAAKPSDTLPAGATLIAGLPWLGREVGGGEAIASAPPVPPTPAPPAPIPASGGPAPQSAAPPVAAGGKVPSDFVLRMMNALDKYQAAAKLRAQAPPIVDTGS